MFGGPPMMMPGQPIAGQPFPGQPQFASGPMAPPAAWSQPPLTRPPAAMSQPVPQPLPPRRPVLAEMAVGLPASAPSSFPAAPAPRVRMQADDDAPAQASRVMTMPLPEELGIAASSQPQGNVDWAAARQRLESMGVKCFRVDRTPAGAVSVTFLLWLHGSHPRQVESSAPTEAEALTIALVETERYLRERSIPTR